MPKALVVDDDRIVRELLRRFLTPRGLEVDLAEEAEGALSAVRDRDYDLVLLDIGLPGSSGLEVLRTIREQDRRLPVVLITADGGSDTAIAAMQLGAFDYVTKPLDLPALGELVERAVDSRRMMSTPVALSIGEPGATAGDRFVGRSPAMVEVFKAIGRVAAGQVPVLIHGESGTGKELVARAIYQHSPRSAECYMAINCAALPDNLLESELFGHEKGAFTGADRVHVGKFEQCNGGTIFLDEVGDMSPLTQGKVLRLLQEQRFERVGGNRTIETDVRIVAATNRNLEQMVAEGTFREDLYYRLNGMTITLPPLRDRKDDIPLLIEHFLGAACRELGRQRFEGISPEALELLGHYHWPGNVRELQSVMRQALLNATGPVIVPSCLPDRLLHSSDSEDLGADASGNAHPASDIGPLVERRLREQTTGLYAEALEAMERYLIARVLRQTQGNQSRAAEILGITRGKLRDRIAQFGIVFDKSVSIGDDAD